MNQRRDTTRARRDSIRRVRTMKGSLGRREAEDRRQNAEWRRSPTAF